MTELPSASNIFTVLGLNANLFLAQLLNFALVVLVVSRFIFKPLLKLMDERSAAIKQGLDDAEKAKHRLTKAEEDAERLRKSAKTEARQVIESVHLEAETERQRLQAETAAALEKQLEEARQRLKQDKELMLISMRKEMVDMIVVATEKVVHAEITSSEAQKSLVDQAIRELEETKL